eukprot:c11285_g1_i1.p1 GENE.c11285_g1_i1~~c11285_g1_i1.p1  ORF type:complete len:762 (-),score=141.98 c11285_g1_i1:56-2341(-)
MQKSPYYPGTMKKTKSGLSIIIDESTPSTPLHILLDSDSNRNSPGGSPLPAQAFLSPQLNQHLHNKAFFHIHPLMTWLSISVLILTCVIMVVVENAWSPPFIDYGDTYIDTRAAGQSFPSDRAFAETRAVHHIKKLVGIGPRITNQSRYDAAVFILRTLNKEKNRSRRDSERIEIDTQEAYVQVNGVSERVMNVVAKIVGTSSNTSILLTANYDSYGLHTSHNCTQGANDNALSVGLMLELFHVMSHDPTPPAHSVVFLFTDYHYSHVPPQAIPMLGANLFASNHTWRKHAKVTLTLEGFGSGRKYLFKTNSRYILDQYQDNVLWPLAHSALRVMSDNFYHHSSEFEVFGKFTHAMAWASLEDHVVLHSSVDTLNSIASGVVQFDGSNLQSFVQKISNFVFLPTFTTTDPSSIVTDTTTHAASYNSVYYPLFITWLIFMSNNTAHALYLTVSIVIVIGYLSQLLTPYRFTIDHNKMRIWRGAETISTFWKSVSKMLVLLLVATALSCGVTIMMALILKALRQAHFPHPHYKTLWRGMGKWFGSTCGLVASFVTLMSVRLTPHFGKAKKSRAHIRNQLLAARSRTANTSGVLLPITQQGTGENHIVCAVIIFESMLLLVFQCFGNGITHQFSYIPFWVICALLGGILLHNIIDFMFGTSFWLFRYIFSTFPIILSLEAGIFFVRFLEGMELQVQSPVYVGLFFGLLTPIAFGAVLPMILHAGAIMHVTYVCFVVAAVLVLCIMMVVLLPGHQFSETQLYVCE